MKIILAPLTFAVLLNVATGSQMFNADARPTKREVRIYLGSWGELECEDSIYCIFPVSRTVDSRSPARGAINALIAGPTEEEKGKGLYPPSTEYLSIKSLTISKGTARLSLRTTRKGLQRWGGSMAPGRFIAVIEKTLKQFPNVRRVIICLDGYADFASQRDGPRKRCT